MPIQKISNELLEIADENSSKKYLSAVGVDEFSRLAEHFNNKTNLLYQAQEQLSHTNKRILDEAKVKTASLEEEKAIFETLFNESTDGMLLIKNRRFIKCNQAVVDILEGTLPAFDNRRLKYRKHEPRVNRT